MPVTCFIRYDLDPFKVSAFEEYARVWGEAIPRCGGDLVGYFAPHEGSAQTAYGLITTQSLADYEVYKAHLREDKQAQDNFAFAKREGFIRREDRIWLRQVSGPKAALRQP